ncbi:MAG: acyl-CoA thioesterase [Desulfuromonadales bacterium]|nr:acyl-CoA thioesterase [Desulfuromonadales bacterium]
MEKSLEIEVAVGHTDELGHLNHVQAVEYLQSARLDLYDACGLRPAGSETPLGTIVVNLNVNYRRECFLGDRLRVTTRLLSLGSKSFRVEQQIVRPDGVVAIDAVVTSVVMEMASRRVIAVPPVLARLFPSPDPV